MSASEARQGTTTAMTTHKVTIRDLVGLRRQGCKAAFVTAYDYPTAWFADQAGVDLLLVGDSAAMTMLGLPSTLGIGMKEMLVFARAVTRAAKRAFVIGDMPFLSYQPSDECAIRNAGAFIRAGCDAVKCEGGARIVSRVEAMVGAGIPVMGHLGLTPQNAGQLGGYRVQGKTPAERDAIVDDALTLQKAGAFAILLEAMPPETASCVREHLEIPVYGIGAGPHLDGQLLISHDLLGAFVGDIAPRFVKRYADVGAMVEAAFRAYADEVRAGKFPGAEHCYPLDPGSEAEFLHDRMAREKGSAAAPKARAACAAIPGIAPAQDRARG
jgi:3-methyl-2-oxobutanoate hydroxymethyltransferase